MGSRLIKHNNKVLQILLKFLLCTLSYLYNQHLTPDIVYLQCTLNRNYDRRMVYGMTPTQPLISQFQLGSSFTLQLKLV